MDRAALRCYAIRVEPEWLEILRAQADARQDPWVVLEGRANVEAAVAGWWDVAGVVIEEEHPWEGPAWSGLEILRRSRKELGSMGEAARHQGVLGLAKRPREIGEIAPLMASLEADALLLVCPRLTDPGRAGELVRLAHSHAAAAVLFGAEGVSPFAADAVMASCGDVFRLPVRVADGGQLLRCLKAAEVTLVGIDGEGSDGARLPSEGRRALVIGAPMSGLGGFWRAACDLRTGGRAEDLLEKLRAKA